jgi:FO synthase
VNALAGAAVSRGVAGEGVGGRVPGLNPARTITFSPSHTLPLTHDCPWDCAYCGYRSDRDGLISEADFNRGLDIAARAGATEILFLSGEVPDSLPHLRRELQERGFPDFVAFVRWACERALEAGFLPHSNIGAMSDADFERLAPVNASMGLMLENVDDAFNRTVAPRKSASGRLRTLEAAGRARVPYTSGILIGLGESRESRLRSLDALAEVHARHGHLQEIILQNYIPNAGSRLPALPAPTLEEYHEMISHWRRVAPDVPIQIPPNINPHWRELLPWVDDLGGISADGDLVNPLNPWEPPERYARICREAGARLVHRWPVYDRFLARGWVSEEVRAVLRRRELSGPQGAMVDEAKSPGSAETFRAKTPASWRDPLSKALRGDALTPSEALRLATADGAAPGELAAAADELNRRLNGDEVTYVVNRNANFTNVCTTNCSFCGFYRPKGHAEAYTRSVGAVVERVMKTPWVTEVCLQGGIHPDLGFDYYLELLRALRSAMPGVHLHAYSPMEIRSLELKTGRSATVLLEELMAAGLGSMPGTAAEILDDSVRDRLSPEKVGVSDWIRIVSAAHRLGLRSTATVMFGHGESWDALLRHMDLLRDLHRRTGGFTEFIPLAFVPHRNRLGRELSRTTPGGAEEVARGSADRVRRLYPLARLFFGAEMRHLQTSWVKLGTEEAAAMLKAGCDDFGGTLYEESITRESGGEHGECRTPEELESAIRSVGKTPRRRTTLYGLGEG